MLLLLLLDSSSIYDVVVVVVVVVDVGAESERERERERERDKVGDDLYEMATRWKLNCQLRLLLYSSAPSLHPCIIGNKQ